MKIGTNRLRLWKKKISISTLIFLLLSFILYTLHTTRYTLGSVAYADIAGTKHDLSASGTGNIKATAVTQKCVFCHTPHSSTKEGPLWNHLLSGATYTPPKQESVERPYLLSPGVAPGTSLWLEISDRPDGSSRLCLGCHDGAVAIGSVLNMPGAGMAGVIDMSGVTAEGKMPTTTVGYLGTDFTSKHHVFSLAVNDQLISDKYSQCQITAALAVRYPPGNDPVKLYRTDNKYKGNYGLNNSGIQCRTCHDPHDNINGKFLTKGTPGANTPLCETCHYDICP